MTLTEQILKAAEFIPPATQSHASQFYIDTGKHAENTRLKPLILALASAVEALEHHSCGKDNMFNVRCKTDSDLICPRCQTLTTLRQALEGME